MAEPRYWEYVCKKTGKAEDIAKGLQAVNASLALHDGIYTNAKKHWKGEQIFDQKKFEQWIVDHQNKEAPKLNVKEKLEDLKDYFNNL